MQFLYYFDFSCLICAWQGLPCNKSECLYPSGLISNLALGRAYHAFCILFEFSFPFWCLAGLKMQVMYLFDFVLFSLLAHGRAYHAINLNDCTLNG